MDKILVRAEIWELYIINTKDSAMALYVYIGKWVYKRKCIGSPRHGMKKCGEVEVESNSILNSDLGAGEWQI